MTYQIIQNDILKWTKEYRGEPYHAIFADPPYHLTSITKRFGKPGSAPAKGGVYRRSSAGFMSQSWDGTDESGIGIAFRPETWAALSQHLHPGGFVMAFASSRGWHRMACAMEDSGLVIHPSLFYAWTFLSGFPKATRIPDDRFSGHRYGLQSLKPAVEPIVVAQVPYSGRPVDCITRTGAGAWNIDGGRIGTSGKDREKHLAEWNRQQSANQSHWDGLGEVDLSEYANDLGRWPANLLLSEEGASLLDRQSGESVSRHSENRNGSNAPSLLQKGFEGKEVSIAGGYNDSGGASRMFFRSDWSYEILEQLENADPLKYEPKVSSSEGNAGAEAFYWAITPKGFKRVEYEEWQTLDPKKRAEGNIHPTKKPISLCKYISELISPPDAYAPRRLLIPFSGSGSEMIGGVLSGKWEEITGIDSNPNYHEISKARLAWWSQWPGWGQTDVDKILASLAEEAPAEQLSLFEA